MKYPVFQRWQLENFRAVWRFRWENQRVMVPRIQVLALGPLSPRLHPALRSDMRTSLGPEVGVPSSNVAGKSSRNGGLELENYPYWTFQQTIFDDCTINIILRYRLGTGAFCWSISRYERRNVPKQNRFPHKTRDKY